MTIEAFPPIKEVEGVEDERDSEELNEEELRQRIAYRKGELNMLREILGKAKELKKNEELKRCGNE